MSKYSFEMLVVGIVSYLFFITAFTVSSQSRNLNYKKSTAESNPPYVEPDITQYVVHFEKIYNVVVDVEIQFVNKLTKNRIGECTYWSDGSRLISILKPWWEKEASELRKKALIYHELGHCQLNLFEHNNKLKLDLCPRHLMHSSIPSYRCLLKHWDEYEKGLTQ